MIKTIIFDFGDVFINLDKPATEREFLKLGEDVNTKKMETINTSYEIGKITTSEFISHYQRHLIHSTDTQIIDAWNAILKDFPRHRLQFLKQLAAEKKYRLILLSNTNELHIDWIKKNITYYKEFKDCFDFFYLSHEIHLRKPNTDIFQFVMNTHQLLASETMFIDDTTINTDSAAKLGIHVWNNDPETEDITDLFTIKSELF
ncbi:HAD family phosphatase [Aquimarina addita]|uniref:HAD family phosphatase n=1 Tax=Aquimarina addita TaxID=870485 RepID=A0ABP6UU71_9FLAO